MPVEFESCGALTGRQMAFAEKRGVPFAVNIYVVIGSLPTGPNTENARRDVRPKSKLAIKEVLFAPTIVVHKHIDAA